MLIACLVLLGAYLMGAIPFGLFVCKFRGVDIRRVGSGNIGATNVARAIGKKGAMLVLFADLAKGLGVVVFVRWGPIPLQSELMAGAMFAAVLGHTAPVFLRFRGGKGVATAMGVWCGAMPLVGTVGVLIYLVVYLKWRISSAASLSAVTIATVMAVSLPFALPLKLASGAIWLLVIIRHRDNLKRLWAGTEAQV